MPKDIRRRAEEICVNGNATEYVHEVTRLVEMIVQNKCNIACDYVNDYSRHLDSFEDGKSCRIWISVHKVRAKPIHIVWDIMHEFGHHLSGAPEKGEVEDTKRRLKREELAWNIAEMQLEGFPTLKLDLADFLEYKDYCLRGYRSSAM